MVGIGMLPIVAWVCQRQESEFAFPPSSFERPAIVSMGWMPMAFCGVR